MNENNMLKCLIAFILGYLVSRHMTNRIVRNGFNIGGLPFSSCDPGPRGTWCCPGFWCNN